MLCFDVNKAVSYYYHIFFVMRIKLNKRKGQDFEMDYKSNMNRQIFLNEEIVIVYEQIFI